ncbi:glycosyltransferase [Endozoicomonas sp. SCSIO W0465]|uniref:glycosyltransferase n=1 Tax=Endozoicomonas sp. SCSIO W0465 TaxID=2918516 RepID=UPI002076279B|nr:glycosyltransferase [Endozoicomonas sp. SCSIO W0465]USE35175.1 glycosyltransferase [Endozoicomonas sp. SCSIO W0465]
MTSPPVIAQIVQHLAPGGIETMALDIQRKASNPKNVHIISLEGTPSEAIRHWPRLEGLERVHFLGKPPGLSLSTVAKLSQLLRQINVDVVHTHHIGPLIYGGVAAMLTRCGHVHTEHDAWHLNHPKRRWLVAACFHLLRPSVVADAELVAASIRQHIPLLTPSVVLNGIDTDKFQPSDQTAARNKLNLPTDTPIIGCAARFNEVKNHSLLIHAFSRLPESTHLALAGGGELEHELRDLTRRLNIEQRVHFLGVIDDMPGFYHAIDIFCLASKKEGLPLSPLEAQACQRVVVITDVGGCREAVDPESGLLIKAGSTEELETALKTQLSSGINKEKQESARNFVVNHCNLERMIGQYDDLYCGRPK